MSLYIGFIGMAMLLFAFIMNQAHKWDDEDIIYDAFNAVGGLLMVIYAYLISSYPFLILNGIWEQV